MFRRKEEPPRQPAYMSDAQMADYLRNLRGTRPDRPTGSRPAPTSRFAALKRSDTISHDAPAEAFDAKHVPHNVASPPALSLSQQAPQTASHAVKPTYSIRSPFIGRPIARQPSATAAAPSTSTDATGHQRTVSAATARTHTGLAAPADHHLAPAAPSEEPVVRRIPSTAYMERGTRWMEKQEAHSIRQAMEDLALAERQQDHPPLPNDGEADDDARIHAAARDEAAELVWRHRNPDASRANPHAPFPNPDTAGDAAQCPAPEHKRDYRSHLRKGSYMRNVSVGVAPAAIQLRKTSGSSGDSGDEAPDVHLEEVPITVPSPRKVSPPNATMAVTKTRKPSGPSYGGLAQAVANDISLAHRRVSSGPRRVSSGSRRVLSGEKKHFMHPDDKIWEDSQHHTLARKKVVVLEPVVEPMEPAKAPSPTPAAPTAASSAQPTYVRRNPFARVRMQADSLERSQSDSSVETVARHRIEVHKNPPSQSRNPNYVTNHVFLNRSADSPERAGDESPPKSESPTSKHGVDIRSDDIRAATSKSRKDYSPKLPRPTLVSDKPGRPIVSFKQDLQPKETVMQHMESSAPRSTHSDGEPVKASNPFASQSPFASALPPSSINAYTVPTRTSGPSADATPPIPTINLPSESSCPTIPVLNFGRQGPIPVIALPEDDDLPEQATGFPGPIPVLNFGPPSTSIDTSNGRPSTSPTRQAARSPMSRPLAQHSASSPLPKSSPHYTPTMRSSGVLCAHCALPIAGRILSAAGARFHPSCFNCHQCATNLELVEFYPEPEADFTNRVNRIEARQAGFPIPPSANYDEISDGDASRRFYCHLDFHELFSPRCKSCRTPIEGEVVLACGAEWHVGHFFCAQCGDPFDSHTPFVEKDGYAWCVACHTNRYSPKCRRCRKPVVDTVVNALGAEWHVDCFTCRECNGPFPDGRYFLRGEVQEPVCVACEERRLKA